MLFFLSFGHVVQNHFRENTICKEFCMLFMCAKVSIPPPPQSREKSKQHTGELMKLVVPDHSIRRLATMDEM